MNANTKNLPRKKQRMIWLIVIKILPRYQKINNRHKCIIMVVDGHLAILNNQITNKEDWIISIVAWFVSCHSKTRQLKGVREDSRYGKQICVLAEDLKGTIEPNVLYSVELKPMHKAKGYVVIAATPVQFPATVETIIVLINFRKFCSWADRPRYCH